MAETLRAGDDAVLNDRCPWPERRGLLAHIVDTDGAEHQYPVHGLGRSEVVVYVSEDPWEARYGTTMLPNGKPWTCVVKWDCLTPLTDFTGDLRRHLRHWTQSDA